MENYLGAINLSATAQPNTLDTELSRASDRVRVLTDRLRALADRLGGPRPEAVSGEKQNPAPSNVLSRSRELNSQIGCLEEQLGRAENYLG